MPQTVQTVQTIAICLFDLPPKDEAVIKRVMAFSQTQGLHFQEQEATAASLLVVGDQTELPVLRLPADWRGVLIRIADPGNTLACDVLLQRPLLVTRVMRTLDEALRLLQAQQAVQQTAISHTEATIAIQTTASTVGLTNEHNDGHNKQTGVQPASEPALLPNNTQNALSYHHYALVVDDSAPIRKQLELELRQAGIGTDFAETGEEALLKVAAQRYDLVFLDIIMPGMDGFETCKLMRQRPDLKKTPIIMLSAKTSPLDEVQGVIAGASTYLTKPVKSEQLQKTLHRVSKWLDNFQKV
ncbi:MAG: hypothetical protein CR991_09205 [Proteobacteria bacterium]|nr:MAG: hypothetical protein CR991_09205 [Pseudomonadota bacterium]